MPVALAGIFTAIVVFTIICARITAGKYGTGEGARLGVLFGIFLIGAFVPVKPKACTNWPAASPSNGL